MLTLGGRSFTEGQAPYSEFYPDHSTNKQAIYVEVILNVGIEIRVYAMVDTGAPWCIFDTELVEALGLGANDGERIRLNTPRGNFTGTIQIEKICLKAILGKVVRYRCQHICAR